MPFVTCSRSNVAFMFCLYQLKLISLPNLTVITRRPRWPYIAHLSKLTKIFKGYISYFVINTPGRVAKPEKSAKIMGTIVVIANCIYDTR